MTFLKNLFAITVLSLSVGQAHASERDDTKKSPGFFVSTQQQDLIYAKNSAARVMWNVFELVTLKNPIEPTEGKTPIDQALVAAKEQQIQKDLDLIEKMKKKYGGVATDQENSFKLAYKAANLVHILYQNFQPVDMYHEQAARQKAWSKLKLDLAAKQIGKDALLSIKASLDSLKITQCMYPYHECIEALKGALDQNQDPEQFWFNFKMTAELSRPRTFIFVTENPSF